MNGDQTIKHYEIQQRNGTYSCEWYSLAFTEKVKVDLGFLGTAMNNLFTVRYLRKNAVNLKKTRRFSLFF